MRVGLTGVVVCRTMTKCALRQVSASESCLCSSGGLRGKRLTRWDRMQKEIADRRIAFGTSRSQRVPLETRDVVKDGPTLSSSVALAQEAP